MDKTDFTYANARIKSKEAFLLTSSDYETILNAENTESILRFLSDKGWNLESKDIESSLENELAEAWQTIKESISEPEILEALILENDFHNIKAAVKAVFSNLNPDDYYMFPCTVDTSSITEAVQHNNFKLLPDYIRSIAVNAYNTYVASSSGQDAEIVIDKAFFDAYYDYADKSGSALLKEIADIKCVFAAVKTALRCVKCGKTDEFAVNAIPQCKEIDTSDLYNCVKSGKDFSSLFIGTKYDFLTDVFSKDFSDVENFCDNYILSLTEKSQWEVYGPDPLISYWIKKQNEIRNVRIIISAKSNGISADEIRTKVRCL